MKRLGSLLVVAFGTVLIAFACGGNSTDESERASGNGGSNAGASGDGGGNDGGTAGVAGGGRGGSAGRAGAGAGGSGRGGRGATGGAGGAGGGGPAECPSGNTMSDIEGEACDDESAFCAVGEECCCGECSAELDCSCDDGRWSCFYTDFCAFVETCGGAGGQGGQAGQAGQGS